MMNRMEGLCDVVFYREDCLRNHFNHMLTIHDKRGEHQKSCCQFFKYCSECYSVVKQYEWINNRWHCHNCSRVYCDYCKGFKQEPCLCCMKSIDIVSSLLLRERIFFYFETHCDGFNTCFEVYYCVMNVICKLCMKEAFDSRGSDVCPCCGNCVEIFSGDYCMDRFCEYMVEMSEKCRCVWIVHNSAHFEALFTLHWFLTKNSNVIINGKCYGIG